MCNGVSSEYKECDVEAHLNNMQRRNNDACYTNSDRTFPGHGNKFSHFERDEADTKWVSIKQSSRRDNAITTLILILK